MQGEVNISHGWWGAKWQQLWDNPEFRQIVGGANPGLIDKYNRQHGQQAA
jgi:hypothetical protein